MKGDFLPAGKLNPEILRPLLRRYARTDEKVLIGPGIGEDAAAIDMGEKVLVVATDPITFATDEIGYYSVMVNGNDVATSGAEPKWYSVTILLPEIEGNKGLVEPIFRQVHEACEKLGVSLVGGHTEITHGLDRPILVGQMMGLVEKGAQISTSGARAGDMVLLSKGICIEGTSLVAREKEEELLSRGMDGQLVERARGFLFDPGISVVREALLASQTARVHAMHDPTEGGLANGLHELAEAAGVQIEVDRDSVPIFEESRRLCGAFGLDPWGVIASGALLLTASPRESDKIIHRARQEGVSMTRIGRVTGAGTPSVEMVTAGGREPVPYFERDEVARVF